MDLLGTQISLQDINALTLNKTQIKQNFFTGLSENPLVCQQGATGRRLITFVTHTLFRHRHTALLRKMEQNLKTMYTTMKKQKLQITKNSQLNQVIFKDILSQNWEKFKVPSIINIQYRFALVYAKANFISEKPKQDYGLLGRNNFKNTKFLVNHLL